MNTLNPCTAVTTAWSGQGTGLPFAGSAAAHGASVNGTAGFAAAIAPAHAYAPMTLAAVRQDDAKVPDPRGRQR